MPGIRERGWPKNMAGPRGVKSVKPHTLLLWHVKADDPLRMGESPAFGVRQGGNCLVV
jgi:hypothetical protein